jgi:hypothetical protein
MYALPAMYDAPPALSSAQPQNSFTIDVSNINRTALGPGFEGHPADVFRDELKDMDVLQWARAFKARVDDYLIRQTDSLATPTPWVPFPLTIMTFVGIELLGIYKHGDPRNSKNRHFQRVVERDGPKFCKYEKESSGRRNAGKRFHLSGVSKYLHTWVSWEMGLHNPSRKEAKTWVYGVNDSHVVLNIFWFYGEFKRVYTACFESLLQARDHLADPLRTFEKTFRRHFSEWL